MQIVIDDEKIIDLLETEWGYVGIREDVRRLLIENGTPLEDIKEEIKEKAKEHIKYTDYGRRENGLYEALKIIDNHISELKGENNADG